MSSGGGADASSRILVEEDGQGIVTITINRPEALNALTRPMMQAMAQAFKRIRLQGTAKAIILTGAGRAFCSGVDLTAAQTVFQGDVTDVEADPVVQMELCQIPIIGAINGHAVTAGFEIALACDILVASTAARFVDTHCKFGIFPSWGLSQKLSRLIGANRARQVSLTALPVDAASAEKWGLVNSTVPPDELLPTARKIAAAIASNHTKMVLNYKRVIDDGLALPLGEARKLEKERAWAYYKDMKPEDFQDMQKFIARRARSKL